MPATPAELRAHIDQLCAEIDARFIFRTSTDWGGSSTHSIRLAEVYGPEWNEQAYCIALHELGHLAVGVKYGYSNESVVIAEAHAWRWFFDHCEHLSRETLHWAYIYSWSYYTSEFGLPRHKLCQRVEARFNELATAA